MYVMDCAGRSKRLCSAAKLLHQPHEVFAGIYFNSGALVMGPYVTDQCLLGRALPCEAVTTAWLTAWLIGYSYLRVMVEGIHYH